MTLYGLVRTKTLDERFCRTIWKSKSTKPRTSHSQLAHPSEQDSQSTAFHRQISSACLPIAICKLHVAQVKTGKFLFEDPGYLHCQTDPGYLRYLYFQTDPSYLHCQFAKLDGEIRLDLRFSILSAHRTVFCGRLRVMVVSIQCTVCWRRLRPMAVR